MKKGIILAGNIIVDSIKKIDNYPEMGMLSTILSISQSTGGAVPNMGIDLKLMDSELPVKAFGLIGDDENGSFALERMSLVGVDTSDVKKITGVSTGFTDVMTVQKTGERTFFHSRGANSMFGPEHLDFEKMEGYSIFHIGYALLLDKMDRFDDKYGTVMARVIAKASECGLITSLDVVSESGDRFAKIVSPSLKYCDYLIINEIESSRICGIPSRNEEGELIWGNIPKILRAMLDKGVRKLAIIHAPEGGWYLDNDGNEGFKPALKLAEGSVKGTVGAGDAFCSGVLYALNVGYEIEKALDLGIGAAACVLLKNDGFGVKPLCEIKSMLSSYPRKENRNYTIK